MAASVRRLISHSRNRSEDVFDSEAYSSSPPSSSSPSRKHKNASQRSQIGLPGLGKVGSADSGSSRRARPLQISSPQLPDLATGDAAASVMSGDVTRSATVHTHRRNVSDNTGVSSTPQRKYTIGGRSHQRKPPLLMHQRPLKPLYTFTQAGSALQRSASLRQGPPRPPRPDEVPQRTSSRRPSLKSISSDSFIQTRNSRASLASSDPGSIFLDRSKDDLDGNQDDNVFTDELRKFILEADKAFQLGGDPTLSLPKHRQPIKKPDPPSRTGSTTPRAVTPRPPIPRKSVGSGTSVKRKNSTSRPLKQSATVSGKVSSTNQTETHEDTSVVRRNSATAPSHPKTIQKKSQPSATMPRKKVSWEARLEAKGSKWGLSEGMTEILTGQRFKKIEADEMLPPERMELLMAKREMDRIAEAAEASDKWEASSEMGIDPNTSWIDIGLDTSEGEMSPVLSASRSKSSSPDLDGAFPRTPPSKDDEMVGEELGEEIPIIFRGSSYEDVMPPKKSGILDPVNDALPPTPPPKSARRKLRISTSKANRNTKTVEEATKVDGLKLPSPAMRSSASSIYTDSSFSPGPATPVAMSELQRKLSPAEDEDNIYLRSTPFTFTHPAFEHGAITFSKAEVGKGAMKMDDTLDWTAFQMAILGGAGDMGDVVDEWEDARLSEELVNWFDSHGFEDWGRMVMEEEALRKNEEPASKPAPLPKTKTKTKSKSKSQSSISSISSSSASSSTSSLDSISSSGGRFGTGSGATPPPLNIRRKQPPLPTLTARCMPSNDGALGSARASVVQATKSPARGPAVVGGGGPGDVDEDEADAPMGFNLSNDLGEYLQWEAEYAYATDL